MHVEGYAETSWDLSIVVADASRGNRAAVEVLLSRIQPLIVRYCRARLGKMRHLQSEPDELAREVCLAVLTALPDYRAQGRPFLAFVYGIAANRIAHWSRVNELESAADQRVMPSLEAHYAESDQLAQMTELLSRLPSKQRDILVLRVACGLSAEETADAIGSTPGAVRVAQHRALTRLRKEIDRLS
ncbi:RNA polymerase sigma factor ShbA [Lentzea sp. CA-135723]|uniref:RNA polymerase sigma factor ShbA n=1 Tax=Lentzea sp. CA-135723 TaxID=3239950 RepID=UPI003D916550